MTENYGNLLYYVNKPSTDDPYSNYKVVSRLATRPLTGQRQYEIPDDPLPVKLDRCRWLTWMTIPSNFVPDNDFVAKSIKKLTFNIMNQPIFEAFTEGWQYTIFNHCVKKLNLSPHAQEVELFPEGRFDAFDCDADELETRRVKCNGKTLVENRQQYAIEIWKDAKEQIELGLSVGGLKNSYERLYHQYFARAPINHGLARQPRVLPPASNLRFTVSLADVKSFLLQWSDYQKCRMPVDLCYEKVEGNSFKAKFGFPYNENLLMEEDVIVHEAKGDCDCLEKNNTGKTRFETGEFTGYEEIHQLGKTPHAVDETYKALNKEGGNWRAHRTFRQIPKVVSEIFDGEEYAVFWVKNEDQNLKASDVFDEQRIESVYMNPSKEERPLTTSTKGLARIPFYYPTLKVKELNPGKQEYRFTLSSGALPEMIIFTGLRHTRTTPSFDVCMTKTTLFELTFVIKEFEIFVDNNYAFGTPWFTPRDHYINFLKHNGRYDNKSIGEGVDYFQFVNENWIIPMSFADRAGKIGTVEVRIVFESALVSKGEHPETWDAYWLTIPVDNFMLDKNRKSKFIYYIFVFLI